MKDKQVVCVSKGTVNNSFHVGWKYRYFTYLDGNSTIHVNLRGKRGFWTVPKTVDGVFTHGTGLMFRVLEETDEQKEG